MAFLAGRALLPGSVQEQRAARPVRGRVGTIGEEGASLAPDAGRVAVQVRRRCDEPGPDLRGAYLASLYSIASTSARQEASITSVETPMVVQELVRSADSISTRTFAAEAIWESSTRTL